VSLENIDLIVVVVNVYYFKVRKIFESFGKNTGLLVIILQVFLIRDSLGKPLAFAKRFNSKTLGISTRD